MRCFWVEYWIIRWRKMLSSLPVLRTCNIKLTTPPQSIMIDLSYIDHHSRPAYKMFLLTVLKLVRVEAPFSLEANKPIQNTKKPGILVHGAAVLQRHSTWHYDSHMIAQQLCAVGMPTTIAASHIWNCKVGIHREGSRQGNRGLYLELIFSSVLKYK